MMIIFSMCCCIVICISVMHPTMRCKGATIIVVGKKKRMPCGDILFFDKSKSVF